MNFLAINKEKMKLPALKGGACREANRSKGFLHRDNLVVVPKMPHPLMLRAC
jgi:hypothetical protein